MALHSYTGAVLTPEGRAALDLSIADLTARLEKSKSINEDKGARGCGEAGGCKAQDEATRQHDLYRLRRDDAVKLRKEAKVAIPPTTRDRLGVGHVAKLLSWAKVPTSRTPVPTYQYVHVVGFNEGDCDACPRKLAYNSPLITPFIGQRAGYEEHLLVANNMRLFRLARILLPSDREVQDFIVSCGVS